MGKLSEHKLLQTVNLIFKLSNRQTAGNSKIIRPKLSNRSPLKVNKLKPRDIYSSHQTVKPQPSEDKFGSPFHTWAS